MLAAALLAVTSTGCTTGKSSTTQSSTAQTQAQTQTTRTAPPRNADAARQTLSWKACPPPTAAEGGSSGRAPGPDWECATLHAPLDYAKPRSNANSID
ncbi:hypothetical protein ABZ943_41095, partial [Streptomyces rubiginosohelvolus]